MVCNYSTFFLDRWFGDNFKTASLISFPGLNFTMARWGMGTSVSGRFGFRPIRALRTLTSKTPKFRISTVFPFATAAEIRSSVRCTKNVTSCRAMSVSSLICITRSRFVIGLLSSISVRGCCAFNCYWVVMQQPAFGQVINYSRSIGILACAPPPASVSEPLNFPLRPEHLWENLAAR